MRLLSNARFMYNTLGLIAAVRYVCRGVVADPQAPMFWKLRCYIASLTLR